MGTKKKFITADKSSDYLYLDCPGRCGSIHILPKEVPTKVRCGDCNYGYVITMISNETRSRIRIMIEVSDEG